LIKEGPDLAEQAHIEFVDTPRAKPRAESEETSAMMIRAAAPVLGYEGAFLGVLYGGTLLNRNYQIVDKVKEIVYEDETYKGKDIGTATIFQGDLRISTNVQAKDGSRAVGTRVSAEVSEQLLVKGLPWIARAYVVNAWYKTAYEPIRDIDGNTIGILYVGVLEEPFSDMWRNIFLFFLGIVVAATALAAFLERVVTEPISRPVERMVGATKKLSEGDLGYTVEAETGTTELDALAASFNTMSQQLRERQEKLEATNDELAMLNKTYLDLVGFVSHELKGIVATTMMNTLSVRDALFGEVNPKQKWALDSAIKNLEYLRETVRKFLDLSRIEKGELELNRTPLRLRDDVFEPCLEIFGAQIAERRMKVSNSIDADIEVYGDSDLLRILANNLVGNAVKYGVDNGKVAVSCEDLGDEIRVEVYNDSRPITREQADGLFQKFSRLQADEHKDVRGTGLGLFITKEIVAQHAGKIWVEPREKGNSFIFQIDKNANS
jgi:two-component system NtrC family sensor kinase